MGIKAGEKYLFYWGGEAVTAQTNTDLQSQLNSRETNHKTSGDHNQSEGTRFEGSISLTLLFDENATLDPIDLWNDHKAKEHKESKISTEEVGDYEFVADAARIENWSGGFPDRENIEITCDLVTVGPYDFVEITE